MRQELSHIEPVAVIQLHDCLTWNEFTPPPPALS
jgi:hypothetical protein